MEMRSFADYLRSLDDAALLRLFAHRPDLISPVPPDIASLAARATSAPSLARAVDSLNLFQLQILEACAVAAEPFSEKEILALTDKAAKFLLSDLADRGLIYLTKDGYHIPINLREVLGNEIAGLGPQSPMKLSLKKLDDAPAASKKVLDAIIWGPPRGTVADVKKPGIGVEWLLKENFLTPLNQKTVVMPREVAIYLRGGKVHRELEISPPSLTITKCEPLQVQSAAISNISTFLRWIEEVLNFWAQDPPTALRAGGLGVRDLKTISLHLGIEESAAAFVAEVAYLAGLLTIEANDQILPTKNFDIWITQSASTRWSTLVTPWLISSRLSGLPSAPLGPELDRVSAAPIRSLTLRLLKEYQSGLIEIEELIRLAQWHRPMKRSGGLPADYIRWTLREAEWLGITGQGVLSKYGAQLLTGQDLDLIDNDLPKPVNHILIQSDHTAIAPGPLQHEIAQEIALLADIESRGAATVYRFTESTLRRALDHGRTGEEIKSFLTKISKTPMPQPLEYLILDISKKHGKLRVGNTNTFIRCEDQALIKEILSDKRLESLSLRQISPEVLISQIDADDAISVLRNFGYFPAGEDTFGKLMSGPRIARANSKPRPPRIIAEFENPDEIHLVNALRVLRTGEKSAHKQSTLRNIASHAIGDLPRSSANETLELLGKFLKESPSSSLSIGYADNNGLVSHRIIDPLKLTAGSLLARDHATGEVITFRIARITGVAAL